MKNYVIKSSKSDSPLDLVTDAFESLLKPIFYDEKLDSMKTDIAESDAGYKLDIEMPGYNKEDIKIALEDEYLTVSAERKQAEDSESAHRYLRKERSVSCQRSYYVGQIEESEIKAGYTNGVLSVSLPKKQEEAPKKHTINID